MSAVDAFMGAVDFLAGILLLLVLLDIVAVIALMFMERCDPRSFVAWILLLLFVPPVGFVLYLYMGRTIYWRTGAYRDPSLWRTSIEGSREALEEDLEGYRGYDKALKVAKVLSGAGADTYTRDNSVRLFTEGSELKEAMMESLRSAERSILMEYYIIRDDSDGRELMDVLCEKARNGVEVRLLVDGFGIKKGPRAAIKRLRACGGHYAVFHYWLKLLLSPKKSHRNHRKIAIVDGRTAFTGGFNIGDEYRGEGPLGHWRDASVMFEGGGVRPMLACFAEDWAYAAKKDPLRPAEEYLDPVPEGAGEDRIQIVSGGPDTMPDNQIPLQYLAMIQSAKSRIYITTPYLDPDEPIKAALMYAAANGVDVRILIPSKKDHMFVYWNSLTFADELMKGGVKVYRYLDGFIHEKAVIADDRCCSVGSANLDNRSLSLNFETNVVMYSERLASQLADRFLEDLESSSQYSCEEYAASSASDKARMAVSRLLWMLA